jgi:hypothetical protein
MYVSAWHIFFSSYLKIVMPRNTDQPNENSKPQKPQEGTTDISTDQNVKAAHVQADQDIQEDADLSVHGPNDDLDEGESARLGEDRTDLV